MACRNLLCILFSNWGLPPQTFGSATTGCRTVDVSVRCLWKALKLIHPPSTSLSSWREALILYWTQVGWWKWQLGWSPQWQWNSTEERKWQRQPAVLETILHHNWTCLIKHKSVKSLYSGSPHMLSCQDNFLVPHHVCETTVSAGLTFPSHSDPH